MNEGVANGEGVARVSQRATPGGSTPGRAPGRAQAIQAHDLPVGADPLEEKRAQAYLVDEDPDRETWEDSILRQIERLWAAVYRLERGEGRQEPRALEPDWRLDGPGVGEIDPPAPSEPVAYTRQESVEGYILGKIPVGTSLRPIELFRAAREERAPFTEQELRRKVWALVAKGVLALTDGVELHHSTEADEGEGIRDVWTALGFFRSAIRSGEPWTEECDRIYRAAHGALVALETHSQPPWEPESDEGESVEGEVAGFEADHPNSVGWLHIATQEERIPFATGTRVRITRLPGPPESEGENDV